MAGAVTFRWILQLHKDVPKAARFYSEGLDFTVNVCTLRWAELQSGSLKLSLMQSHKNYNFAATALDKLDEECISDGELLFGFCHMGNVKSNHLVQKGYSSLLSFTVTDINTTVTKLMALGAELDGPIKYEIHGKVAAMRCIDGHMLGLYEPA